MRRTLGFMHDLRLAPPRRLSDLDTTGWRAWVRGAVRLGLAASLAMAIVSFYVERHRDCTVLHRFETLPHAWSDPRTLHDEMGLAPVVMLALALLGQAFAHRGRLLSAVVLGPVAAMVALGIYLAVIATHFFRPHMSDGALATAPWLIAAGIIGLAQSAIEPLLASAERKALDSLDPVFPAARAIRK